MKLSGAPAISLSAVMLLLVAPAHGDPGSEDLPAEKGPAFLSFLQHAGIDYQNPDQAVTAAEAVCGMADGGRSGLEVLNGLMAANPGFTADGAARFAAIAASIYCPQQLSTAAGGNTK